MPASIPGATLAENLANPSAGRPVIFDALSGPKGSPLDTDNTGNASTGAMCTGIGFGLNAGNPFINVFNGAADPADAIKQAGFTDDTGDGVGDADSTKIYIGGGRTTLGANDENVAGEDGCEPYTAGFVPGNAGNGGSRDAGSGPAFTCFVGKWVTTASTAAVANGEVVEPGWANRSGITLGATTSWLDRSSVFGSSTTAQAAVA